MSTELLEQAIDDAMKARVLRRRERALNPLVRRAEAAMGRMFRRQGRTLLRELAKRRHVFTESAEDDAVQAAFDAAANDPEMVAWLETYGSAAFAEAVMATGTFLALDAAFELPFPEATTYARRRSAELVRGLDATTRESLRGLVAKATEKGWSYNRLAAEIRLKFDGFAGKMPQQHIQTRAHMVAVTECFPGSTLVRPLPHALTVPPLFLPVPETDFGRSRRRSEPRISGATRRWFEGDIVNITTASGNELAGTPNHPILTDRGWVPLGRLVKGQYVVCYGGIEKVASGHPDVDDVPTPIGEVFDALRGSRIASLDRVPGVDMDFHGDGMRGQVEIVRASSNLSGYSQSFGEEPFLHEDFAIPDFRARTLTGTRAAANALGRPRLTSRHTGELSHAPLGRGVGVREVRQSLSGIPCGPFESHVFAGATERDADPYQRVVNAVVTGPHLLGDGGTGLPGGVALSEIVRVERRKFAGHVFNLLTPVGAFIANGIVAHNCGNAYEEGNAAAARAVQAVGIALEKAWLTVGDDRVDPNCSANEGAGWIPLDDPFPSGVMHPLDHPACRCSGMTRRAEEKP